jgi:signal transduction histidine kinase
MTSMNHPRAVLALALAVLAWSVGATTQGDAPQARRVLILHTDRVDLPANLTLDPIIRAALTAGGVGRIDLYAEYLDVSRFPGDDHARRQSEFLRQRYADKKPEVVISISDSAVDFLIRHGAGLFPGTPIVVGSTERRGIRNWPLPPGITGAVSTVQFRTTLELMMALHPNTRRVLILAGTSGVDRYWARQMIDDARAVAPSVELVDTGPLSMAQLLKELGSQPPQTVILYHTLFRDGAGETFLPAQLVPVFTKAANAPLYGVYTTQIGLGIVGGHLWSFEKQGAKVAEIALRILRGERAEDIPLVDYDGNEYMFDWRQLTRWGIDEARLPPGSVVRFRQATSWELYRWQIVAACAVIAIQGALIAMLLWQRRQRRQAEMQAAHQRVELAQASRLALAGELTASIAHEIKQPLSAILAHAETAELMLETHEPSISEIQRIIAEIRKDDLRASEVITRLRDLLSKHAMVRHSVDLNQMIDDTLRLLEVEAARRGIAVVTELTPGLSPVDGDRVHLQQVVVNLCLNAMDAMADVSPERRSLLVHTAGRVDGGVEIQVRDTGPGIAEEQLPRLFDSFFTTKARGMGLGLSVSRSIVEAHGGRLSAENHVGGGALFRIALPASHDGKEEAKGQTDVRSWPGDRR